MRRIVLELAKSSTDRICGSCDMLDADRGGFCVAFNEYVEDEVKKTRKGTVINGLRLKQCIAAERAFSRLLDVSPEDAALVQIRSARRGAMPDEAHAVLRIGNALRAHAKKAEVKP